MTIMHVRPTVRVVCDKFGWCCSHEMVDTHLGVVEHRGEEHTMTCARFESEVTVHVSAAEERGEAEAEVTLRVQGLGGTAVTYLTPAEVRNLIDCLTSAALELERPAT